MKERLGEAAGRISGATGRVAASSASSAVPGYWQRLRSSRHGNTQWGQPGRAGDHWQGHVGLSGCLCSYWVAPQPWATEPSSVAPAAPREGMGRFCPCHRRHIPAPSVSPLMSPVRVCSVQGSSQPAALRSIEWWLWKVRDGVKNAKEGQETGGEREVMCRPRSQACPAWAAVCELPAPGASHWGRAHPCQGHAAVQ